MNPFIVLAALAGAAALVASVLKDDEPEKEKPAGEKPTGSKKKPAKPADGEKPAA